MGEAWRGFLLPTFPLLGKELRELAAQRRTYVARVGYALLLVLLFWAAYSRVSDEVTTRGARLGMIGYGGVIFDGLFAGLMWGVMLVMPALGAGAIAREKEQNSLVTLLLTPMRPWELLLQKWASRVIAMTMLLAPALPLFAVCYALGGFSQERIWLGAGSLLLAVLEIGALAVACSAWCRTTLAALIVCYAVIVAIMAYEPLAGLANGGRVVMQSGWFIPLAPLSQLDPGALFRWTEVGPRYYGMIATAPRAGGLASLMAVMRADGSRVVWPVIVAIPSLLIVARIALVRRAQVAGGSAILRAFRGLDRLFSTAERRLGRRIGVELPRDRPVAWREINRRALANPRYLTRLFLPLAVLLLLICRIVGRDWGGHESESFTFLFGGTALMGALALLALGTGLVASERSEQTLGVLLTTPLSGRQILAQKQSALRRMHVLLLALLGLIALIRWFFRTDALDGTHLAAMAATGVLVPAAASWIGIAAGVLLRRRGYALTIALVAAAAWCAAPWIAQVTIESVMGGPSAVSVGVGNLSPLLALSAGDTQQNYTLRQGSYGTYWEQLDFSATALGCALAGPFALWCALRCLVMLPADRLLRRSADA